MSPKVYILVLNYKNVPDTIECMNSILNLDYQNFKAVILDNNSKDGSDEEIKAWINEHNDKRFHFIQTGGNKGYAGGNNVGIRYALGQGDMDYSWIINNDTILDPMALTKIIQYFKENPKVGICGSKLTYSWDKSKIQGYYSKLMPLLGTTRFIKVAPMTYFKKNCYVIGAAMCISKKVLDKIGLLCEDYFLFYEEPDFCLRAQKAGFEIGCAVNSVVYHKEGASTGGSSQKNNQKSKFSDFYMVRSRILFTRKFYPFYLPTVYMGLLITIFNRIRRRQFDRIGMIIKLMINPYRKFSSTK